MKYDEIKEFNRKTGICITCFHEMAEPGKLKCFECAERDRLRTERNRNRKRDHETWKARYEMRKREGICTSCGKAPAEHGYKCNRCYIKAKRRKKPKDIIRSERPSYGLCYICGKPKLEDKSVCEKCYSTRLESVKKICYMPVSDYWKSDNDGMFAKKG